MRQLKRPSRARGWLHLTLHAMSVTALMVIAIVIVQKSFPSSTQLTVTATIPKRTWVRQGSFPQELQLTDADILRGYVEVAAPTVLWVRNNSDDGFQVELEIEGDYVSEVRVRGLSNEFVTGGSHGIYQQPGRFRHDTRFDLRWRLQLAQGAKAGRYPWPVRLQVHTN